MKQANHECRRRVLAGALGLALASSSLLSHVAAQEAPETGGGDLFVDLSEVAGLDFVYFNGMSGRLYFAEMMGGGAALVDYDRDGDLDLFMPQGEMLGDGGIESAAFPPPGGEPVHDQLFRNDTWIDADGERQVIFHEVTADAGIPPGGYGMGVTAGDVDGDGWPDLYITNFGSNRLLLNRRDGTFADATEVGGVDDRRWSVAASLLDYDRDGRLDLYVGNYVEYRVATHRECFSDTGVVDYCGPAGFPSESDRLFRNNGGGTFEDVTRRSGIGEVQGAGLGAVAADFDRNGWSDLFVANDGQRNNLWLNQGDGTFLDEALLAGTAVSMDGHPEASMGVVVGDLNGDGFEDLFMSHLTNETNTVYLGSGSGLFDDASGDSGLGLPSWRFTGFGISLLDYDNDSDLDIFVANGAVKRIEEQLRAGDPNPLHQVNQLFENDGRGNFTEVTGRAGAIFALSEVSRGVASGDIDNDGDVDLVVVNIAGPARLLSNQVGHANGWVGLMMRSPLETAGWTTVGSRASVELEGAGRRSRRIATDGSYGSANDPRRIFGLGGATLSAIEVEAASGRRIRLEDPAPKVTYVVPAEGR